MTKCTQTLVHPVPRPIFEGSIYGAPIVDPFTRCQSRRRRYIPLSCRPEATTFCLDSEHIQDSEFRMQALALSESYLNEGSLHELDFKKSFFGIHYDKLESIKDNMLLLPCLLLLLVKDQQPHMVFFSVQAFLEGKTNDRHIAHPQHGIKRIVIFDIDLHHGRSLNLVFTTFLITLGNGTQSIVWKINEETYHQILEGKMEGLFREKDLRYSTALSMIFFYIHARILGF
ncbi:hypothetical protein BYT27DRAFT_7208317 [Phlegmacium glaucopus]|nr:hypothetical protein BYT27DRAFT_7208317 [Phlegmacium glaucopus]